MRAMPVIIVDEGRKPLGAFVAGSIVGAEIILIL
jgi:hypothetical protein